MKKTLLFAAALALPLLAGATEDVSAEEQLRGAENQSTEAPRDFTTPICWEADLTTCGNAGNTMECTDGIWSDYLCVCENHGTTGSPILRWNCPEVR
ncbi:hypothetical protein MYSTI_02434 [Myxococcus stipitatus DSM 14675]|uniref:Lipoprotein n=1 Tax=Myxococcus stipitatus (strain DSM 14675 / JCM 12634 / Mx s8) TaxID=1278073 RepID=L7U7C8_MYXSD|nr:hypothetical protein [Myxococcus stipitatus]AGC43750.1 hypothetical protein MYSTI_02434 [Myxococcus stipitatus DSM 14675]